MVTCRSVFLYLTTDAVSDECCVTIFVFIFPFCNFYLFVIVTISEICVGKMWGDL